MSLKKFGFNPTISPSCFWVLDFMNLIIQVSLNFSKEKMNFCKKYLITRIDSIQE